MPVIFTQEIASTLNEIMVYQYCRDNAATDEERLFFLEKEIGLINSFAIVQTFYSEFEKYCYDQVESGEGLDSEDISEYWYNLLKKYYGDSFETPEEARYGWAMIPHFYHRYYVYKYATSITYSGIIFNKVESGDKEILGDYIDMLKLGNSMKPSEMLKNIGVDPLDKKVYNNFTDFYKNLVDEYEATLKSMGKL